MILLQVDLACSDELKTIFEGIYKINDTLIFAWSLIPSVKHYRWLHSSIHRFFPNFKADYVIFIIYGFLHH
jgi:hypothetical protein